MTTKRSDNKIPEKLKWLQRFFAVAGRIAPLPAIHLMVRVVFTPKRRALRPPHRELLSQAVKHTLTVNEFLEPKKYIKIKYYTWGKGKRTVMLAHGWEAMALDYYKMIPHLLKAGYRVLAFDGPAHGGSEGKNTNLLHFRDVMYEIIQKEGVPYALIGHSMGGGASCYLLMEKPVRVTKLVLIAIPINSRRFFDETFALLRIPRKMQQIFFKTMEEELRYSIDRMNLITREEPIKAEDILLLYDPEDEVISVNDLQVFASKHPEIKTVIIPDSGHHQILRKRYTIEEVLRFLDDGVQLD
ncbi:MAG: alpha/beta hydrolase [Chitinophagales bacterium]|nr:alpha/beta hydrolase [Chitinophagales bacterium]MDW8419358.1 alpha/beta fold hydrolase [Chitinophagales bacterium]